MGIEPMVSAAMAMKAGSVREQIGISVAKLALDRMEQTGQDINEMISSGSASAPAGSLDPNLGSLLDISV